jgi:hypothetical protein
MNKFALAAIPLAIAGAGLLTYHQVYASDHDDGDLDLKGRSLNLTDHFTFKSPSEPGALSVITYFSPRGLPGHQYFMSTAARYEQHISKVANKTDAPTASDDYVFRYEAAAPAADGTQAVTLTVLKNGTVAGTMTGSTTNIANSKNNKALTVNSGTVGGLTVKWFIGPRADSFTFDVIRFFQVRAFLAQRFFGGPGGIGDATATLAPNCRGDAFLGPEGSNGSDADLINLWNPPSCAPDFTKNFNVMSIAMNAQISELGGTVFDTWSTISVDE